MPGEAGGNSRLGFRVNVDLSAILVLKSMSQPKNFLENIAWLRYTLVTHVTI